MKKIVRVMALCTVLGVSTISCQKDMSEFQQMAVGNATEKYTLTYYVDGDVHHAVLSGENMLDSLLHNLFAIAKEGHRVVVSSREGNLKTTREVVVYTTHSEADARNWSRKMIAQGYSVDIEYNPRTGIYTCTAIR